MLDNKLPVLLIGVRQLDQRQATNVVNLESFAHSVEHPRHDPYLKSMSVACSNGQGEQFVPSAGERYDDALRPSLPDRFLDVLRRSEIWHVGGLRTSARIQPRLVIEYSDRVQPVLRSAMQPVHQLARDHTVADDQGRSSEKVVPS